jgi:hypothetical protein
MTSFAVEQSGVPHHFMHMVRFVSGIVCVCVCVCVDSEPAELRPPMLTSLKSSFRNLLALLNEVRETPL